MPGKASYTCKIPSLSNKSCTRRGRAFCPRFDAAKRMGSEFLGKRSPSSRLDVADVLPGGFWEEELAARSPAAALRAARLLRAAAGVNRFGGGGAYDNDDDDDLDLAMAAAAAAAKQKRIGSEFLGKRSSTSDLLPKRMGSEFLGRRKRDAFHSSPDA
ncbi:hypothetical protein HPB49_024730 [Dermacentor silvarum]|uniref:Uncharacterized protein n=1 Tax=Dermacentor silvarum TaxID=543639 RepID=A0ACB8CC44_DERSI|nr:hypothetical protein HPB49_024730 [Dermacentor silvarum]